MRRDCPGYRALAVGLALVGITGPTLSGAAAPTADAMLQGVQRWLDGTRDLEARFSQELVSGALGAALEESGRLYLARPGRMRWDYLEPERKVAVVVGRETRLYIEEDRQLWRGELDAHEDILPRLLAGDRPLATWFEPSLPAASADHTPGPLALRLVPRDDGGEEGFEEILLRLDPEDFSIRGAEVLDAAGNRMAYRFSSVARNRGVDPALFVFEPPPGTEILARP